MTVISDSGNKDSPRNSGPSSILTLSARDQGGGAADVGFRLARSYRDRGYRAPILAGDKRGNDPHVTILPDSGGQVLGLRDAVRPLLGRVRGAGRLHEFLHGLGRPPRLRDRRRGIEDWTLPASHRVLDLSAEKPDLIHAHNLHSFRGAYGHFDLSALPELSRKVPVVLTLHDAWLMTGHCAHPVNCDRWRTGCGDCPDLGLYPPVRRDATAENWQRKRDVLAQCRLYVATPCRWLMNRVEQSILRPAVIESRVIPNGVDLTQFTPGDRLAARRRLDLPEGARILLFAAQGVKGKSYKDFPTLRRAAERIAARLAGEQILFLALGEDAPNERAGDAEIRFIPYESDPDRLADYYRAADLYLHAARAETFPTAILEAMACGRPVVATATGGIPEQITKDTGIIVPAGDAEKMAEAAAGILIDDGAAKRFGRAAARSALENFDLEHQAEAYLSWFRDIINGANT